MKKILIIVYILIISSAVLSGCSSGQTPAQSAKPAKALEIGEEFFKASDPSKNPEKATSRKDTFIATISAPGGVFLPFFYDNGWDGNVIAPVFAELVGLDKQGKPVPVLAEKWDVSADQLKYTFHLRQGLKFSDGSPLTAEDVAFTLTLLHDPAYNGPVDISLAAIKGGQNYTKGDATSIEGIKVIDPLTIEITTDKVNAQALTLLGGYVLPKAYYGKGYQKGKLDYLRELYPQPIGAGPYKFDRYIPGQEVRYVANENYYLGKPVVPQVIYKIVPRGNSALALQLLQAGEVDYSAISASMDNLEQVKAAGFLNVDISTINDFGLVYVNNAKPYLKDKIVRQALIYGLDRQKYVTAKYKGFGQVANVPVPPVSWAYTEEGITKYDFNTEKAKKLLDDAGWKVGSDGIREKDGQKLRLSYLSSNKDDELIPIAKENYKALGIEFNPEILDFTTLMVKLRQGDYDLASVRTDSINDPHDAISELLSTFPANFSRYANPKLDEEIQNGIGVIDLEKRKAIYKELYRDFTEDPPYILLDYRRLIQAYNCRIENFEIDIYNGISSSLPKIKIQQ